MRESHYIDGAGGVRESLMVISASSSCALRLRLRFEALVDEIGLDHLLHAKSPLVMMAGCYRFAAIDCSDDIWSDTMVKASRVSSWLSDSDCFSVTCFSV